MIVDIFSKVYVFKLSRSTLNKDEFILRKILKRKITQGRQYEELQKHYRLLFDVIQENFTEDNTPTTEAFMIECLDAVTKCIGCIQTAKLKDYK